MRKRKRKRALEKEKGSLLGSTKRYSRQGRGVSVDSLHRKERMPSGIRGRSLLQLAGSQHSPAGKPHASDTDANFGVMTPPKLSMLSVGK